MSITESSSKYDNLEHMSTSELLENINREDQTVAQSVAKTLPQIEAFIDQLVDRMEKGGRLFYIGAGTSGRLGVVDASECPPTFGVDHGVVVGVIAGGDGAIRKAVEFAEDDAEQAWKDLLPFTLTENDTVVGIAASGRTPYVIGGVSAARKSGLLTGCVTCNPDSELAAAVSHPMVAVVGPEFVTGSTRMKAGTAQKLVLNMITTATMIRLGKVRGNRMVDMQLSNEKLVDRGVKMVMAEAEVSEDVASKFLKEHGNVRAAVDAIRK